MCQFKTSGEANYLIFKDNETIITNYNDRAKGYKLRLIKNNFDEDFEVE